MKLRVEMDGLAAIDQEYFKRELHLLEVEYNSEIYHEMRQIRKDRNLVNKILTVLKQHGIAASMDTLVQQVEHLQEMQIFSYAILADEEDHVAAEVELSEAYFAFFDQLRKSRSGNLMTKASGLTREQFKKQQEKACKLYRPKDYRVEVVSEDED